jgi:hypothetical protein
LVPLEEKKDSIKEILIGKKDIEIKSFDEQKVDLDEKTIVIE